MCIHFCVHVYIHNYIPIEEILSGGSVIKNLLANIGDAGNKASIPGLGRTLGGGHGNPLQYSCLGNFLPG